jgi:hypothetical protein
MFACSVNRQVAFSIELPPSFRPGYPGHFFIRQKFVKKPLEILVSIGNLQNQECSIYGMIVSDSI